MPTRPVWAEVSATRLLANYRALLRLAGSGAELMPVVKADAYGHSVLACAPLLAEAGAQWLGVTSAEEGSALRAVCPETRILLMSGIFPGEAGLVLDQELTPVVWEPWQMDLLKKEAVARDLQSVPVHLEIDTGMARQGVRVAGGDASALAHLLRDHFQAGSRLFLEGVMTHFAAPETTYSARPNRQVAELAAAMTAVRDRGLRPRWLHAGNSASLVTAADRPALESLAVQAGARLMLRPGLALYGYLDRLTRDGLSWPGGTPAVSPVLSWKTRVTTLRALKVGETAGYGHTFTAERATRLALLPVGYADGFNRLLSNRGKVLVRAQPAPIAGRVSMDQTMVDVTDIPDVAIGDEVVLLGAQEAETIDAWDLADLTGTIPWEVLCAISHRVPRLRV